MVRPPAGAVWGILEELELVEAVGLADPADGAGVWGDAIVLRARRRR
jgi:hypothetical protein